MSTYYCEGFVKEVASPSADSKNKDEVLFKLEPVAPYMFEKKTDDGKAKKLLLLVDDLKTPIEARICDDDQEFLAPPKCDFSAMLIAKANKLKVRLTADLENGTSDKKDKSKEGLQRETPIVLCELKVL